MPRMLAAAISGACNAISQCSNRSCRWYRPDQNDAQSPTAYTPVRELLSCASTTTPLSILIPESVSQATSGLTPTAVTTTSADSQPPSASAIPPSSIEATAVLSRKSTSAAVYQAAVTPPTSAPIATESGAD